MVTPHANPTKSGYVFRKWKPSLPETIPAENITINAILHDETVYSIIYDFGSIEFNGTNYLDTKLKLFSSDLVDNYFNITHGISNNSFLTGQNSNFNTFFSVMDESGSPYPWIVFRRNASKVSLVANAKKQDEYLVSDCKESQIDIRREEDLLYLNDNQILDLSTLVRNFNTPLSFGAWLNGSGNPFRYSKGNIDDIFVEKDYPRGESVTLPEPTLTDCVFNGWTGSNGNTRQVSVTVPTSNTQDLTYRANFSCSNYVIILNTNGGTVSNDNISVDIGESIGSLPTPTKEGYTFDGWYFIMKHSKIK